MTAPGPWARLVEAAKRQVHIWDAEGPAHGQSQYGTMESRRAEFRAALAACPSPREADTAGEALDSLTQCRATLARVEDAAETGIDLADVTAAFDEASDVLRRAGRI